MSAEMPYASPKQSTTLAKPGPEPRLRLWPAFVFVAAYWAAWAIVTVFYPATFEQFISSAADR